MRYCKYGLALIAFTSTAAFAETIQCSLDSWSGASDPLVTVSWIGTKFEIDTDDSTLRIGNENGWRDPLPIDDVKTNSRFTAYIAYREEKTTKGETYKVRFAYRVYNDGRAQAGMTQPRFVPLKGTGTCS
ncbi:MAG: hypothetical protein AAF826_10965 [Pseudomonadota bacterium]